MFNKGDMPKKNKRARPDNMLPDRQSSSEQVVRRQKIDAGTAAGNGGAHEEPGLPDVDRTIEDRTHTEDPPAAGSAGGSNALDNGVV